MLRLLRRVSLPYLRASWGRTALVVGGIATGVALIVAINVLNTSVLENFRRSLELMAGPADLQITLGLGEVGFAEATSDEVARDSDVEIAVPLVRGTIALADDPAEALQLFGTDLTAEERFPRYRIALTTRRQEAAQTIVDPQAVLLPQGMAETFGVGVGDPLRVATPRGITTLTVRGLLQAEGMAAAFGNRIAVMDLTAAQQLLAKDGRVDQIDVILRPGADRRTVERRLAAALPPTLTVAPPAHRAVLYEQVLASVRAMLTGLSLVCLIAGAYLIYNTTATGAVERALTMAQLRFAGADRDQLFRLVLIETLVLGTIGALLGELMGLGLAYALRGMVGTGFNTLLQLRLPLESLTVDLAAQRAIIALGVATALAAAFAAARRIRALDPLDVLSRAGAQPSFRPPRSARLVLAALMMLALSACAFAIEIRLKSAAWGNVGSTIFNASVFVLAIPLVGWAARRWRTLLPSVFGPEGRFAVDGILRATTRAGITVGAIAGVVTASLTIASLAQSFRQSARDYVGNAIGGDIVVSAVTTEGGWLETPLPDALVADLRAIAGVRAVDTVRVLPGQRHRGERISIMALSDGPLDPARLPPRWYRQGDPERAAAAIQAGAGVSISLSLADRAGLAVGDPIELDTPTGRLALPIVGVVPDYASDRGTVIVGRRLFVERWQEPTVNRFLLLLESGASIPAVRERILARLGDRHRLRVDSRREAMDYIGRKIDDAFAFTDAIQLLIVIVTAAGIFDLLLSAIAERRRELGLWRLIGSDERVVGRAILIESATLGVFGAIFGAATGFASAAIWVLINYPYLLGFFLELHFAYLSAAMSVAVVLSMACGAGWVAARAALRQPILESIRAD